MYKPLPTPIAQICLRLKNEFNLNLVFNKNLGYSKEGYKYRGRYHISSNTIFIDKEIDENDIRFSYTLAHEIGHFILHRKINKKILKNELNDEISDTSRQLILDYLNSGNPRDWIEWQANKFASSFLLPRNTLPMAVIQIQKELNINRNLGKIYLDQQKVNKDTFHNIQNNLSIIYNTSKAAIRIRLSKRIEYSYRRCGTLL